MSGQQPDCPSPAARETRRPGLIGLLVVLLLIASGLFLAYVLRGTSQAQDCALEGRRDCAPPE